MAITLSDLPYGLGALTPHISRKTLNFHYGKHHQAYVDKTNAAIRGGALDDASLEEIILEAQNSDRNLFNNAAQVWNHDFYWRSMKPRGGGKPKGDLAAAIKRDFGGLDGFKEAFAAAGARQFGSGWTWLVARNGKLEILTTPNAGTPLTDGSATPLLTMDVWEHAYYLDNQSRRADYIKRFTDKLINWPFAQTNLERS